MYKRKKKGTGRTKLCKFETIILCDVSRTEKKYLNNNYALFNPSECRMLYFQEKLSGYPYKRHRLAQRFVPHRCIFVCIAFPLKY